MDDDLAPTYDFVIVKDRNGSEYLVVAQNVFETSRVDKAGSKKKSSSYVVEAYISWRESDLAFYRRRLFRLQ